MIIGLVALAIVLWGVMAYNGLVASRNKVQEAFSTMDVYLKKRFDLIPNLVATVKGYASHEAETLEKVVAMRAAAVSGGTATTEEKIEAEKQISGAIKGLMVSVEAYPDLKANTNFLELQGQLNEIEQDIANSRKYYNGCVREYNTSIQTIPTNIIANLGHFTTEPMFQVDDASERKNVKVDFGK